MRVRRDSTGWGVGIPGMWNGIRIEYIEDGGSGGDELTAPDGLTAERARDAISLSWNAVSGASSYEIWRSTTDDITFARWLVSVEGTSYSDVDTTAGVTYRYWVRAVRGEAAGKLSDCVSAHRYPREVTDLRAESVASGVLISWTASPDATLYYVYRNDATTGENSCTVGTTDANFLTDTSAVAEVEYRYWVGAYVQDAEGITGGFVSSSSAIVGKWIVHGDEPPQGTPIFTIEDGVLTAVELNGATEVAIPADVKSIGEGACGYLSDLVSVEIPEGVTNVHPRAFDFCGGLMSITVADGNPRYKSVNGLMLTKDGKTLVQGVNGAVAIPSGVVVIGDSAFSARSGLTSVTMPESITIIGNEAFWGCVSLEGVTIPNGVTEIGDVAFGWCHLIVNVSIPDSVRSIGVNAFLGCSGLVDVTIGDGVTSVGWGAFEKCGSLAYDTETVSGVKMVDGWVVDYTESLPKVLDLTGIRGIGDGAFRQCSALASVIIPNGVKSVGEYAFWQCSGLSEVVIPDSVSTIGYYAFGECEKLTNVAMGVGVADIGAFAFRCCSGMSSLTLPNSVTNIGECAFADAGLMRMTIPSDVVCIGSSAFCRNYKLSDLIIAGSVGRIRHDALGGCLGLTNIVIHGNAPVFDDDVIQGVGEDCVVHVRRGSTGWGVNIPGTWNGIRIEYIEDGGTGSGDLPAPDGLTAERSREAILLSWNAVSGADSYEIWRGTTDDMASPIATGFAPYAGRWQVNSPPSCPACATPRKSAISVQ